MDPSGSNCGPFPGAMMGRNVRQWPDQCVLLVVDLNSGFHPSSHCYWSVWSPNPARSGLLSVRRPRRRPTVNRIGPDWDSPVSLRGSRYYTKAGSSPTSPAIYLPQILADISLRGDWIRMQSRSGNHRHRPISSPCARSIFLRDPCSLGTRPTRPRPAPAGQLSGGRSDSDTGGKLKFFRLPHCARTHWETLLWSWHTKYIVF